MIAVLAFLKGLWGFLRSPLGQVLAGAVVLLGLLWFADARGSDRGVKAERARWEARLTASAKNARATEAKNADASQRAGKAVAVKQAEIRTRTEYLIREVPTYVPYDPGRPGLPVGLVRLLDAAALGVSPVPDAAGRADGVASEITDARLAEVVIGNYGACHANSEQLVAFQEWARATGLAK